VVLSGTWVAPKDGAKVKTAKLALSAKPAASVGDGKVTKVAYAVQWGSKKPKAACTATKAGSGGAWSCTADLWKLGAPLGKLTLSFDVFDDAGDLVGSPDGKRSVTFAAPPPKPTNVTATGSWDASESIYTTVVRWKAVSTPITQGFIVYAAQVVVGEPMPGDPPPPACPKPPFKKSGPDNQMRRFVIRAGSKARQATFQQPYSAAIDCGIWVVAYNSVGVSSYARPAR
jgi:hypothetical protein